MLNKSIECQRCGETVKRKREAQVYCSERCRDTAKKRRKRQMRSGDAKLALIFLLYVEAGTRPPAAFLLAQRVVLTIKWSMLRIGRVVRYRATTTRLNTMRTVIPNCQHALIEGTSPRSRKRHDSIADLESMSRVA
jgi:predicted nucleic acid-binding Zn ribbon protein